MYGPETHFLDRITKKDYVANALIMFSMQPSLISIVMPNFWHEALIFPWIARDWSCNRLLSIVARDYFRLMMFLHLYFSYSFQCFFSCTFVISSRICLPQVIVCLIEVVVIYKSWKQGWLCRSEITFSKVHGCLLSDHEHMNWKILIRIYGSPQHTSSARIWKPSSTLYPVIIDSFPR